jgi:rfaE bifunctional protein kinase chain/domain
MLRHLRVLRETLSAMKPERFEAITKNYSRLRIAIAGDFCLDRYLEIDPAKAETSIETGLEVHNVVNVRSQPGAAGTILNNLVALGVAEIFPVGFCGEDGEGFELRRALAAKRGVRLEYFVQTSERRTFTYCKPLVMEPGKPPRELNRLDSKNWSPTPKAVERKISEAVAALARNIDAMIIMDQVDVPETGVVTRAVLEVIREISTKHPKLLMLADSRRSLRCYPPVCLKMNAKELAAMTGTRDDVSTKELKDVVRSLATSHGRSVFVTLSERGIIGATPAGDVEHVQALPVRGEIDIVGAGDAVTANLTSALASGGSLRESLELAMAAASVVIHQLGTTGTADVKQLRSLCG